MLIGGAEMLSGGGGQQTTAPAREGVPADATGTFVAKVLGETEDVWSQVLSQQTGVQYQKPILVLFSGSTPSGCGMARSAMGPFYCPLDHKVYLDTTFFCPLDHKVYLDTTFFQDMERRLGGGAFPDAYVIAHEVGHHVQNLIGLLPKVQRAQAQADEQTANAISVRTELMADCLAGVWAYYMNQRHRNVDDNDVRQAISTAAAIGDDRLQQARGGAVVPDSFTHGSAQQRVQWLTTGLRSGQMKECDTFAR